MSELPAISGIRKQVLRARQHLADERIKLKQQHAAGSPGIQVCNRLTDTLDTVITELFEAAIEDLFPDDPTIRSAVALVPHGGYARFEMAPYSDVDLMLLHRQGTLARVAPLSSRLIQDIGDIGVELGFSMRTIRQCCKMSQRDPIICSSLIEARFLAGSEKLFSRFKQKFARMVHVKSQSLIRLVEQARREERRKYGDVVHLLEPNVKRSRGALRDIQFIRWIGFLRYGHADPNLLFQAGHLSQHDYNEIRSALDFLLRLRNELHFHAGMARDTLFRAEQQRMAELMGYQRDDHLLAVEKFMRDYFDRTSAVKHISAHLVDRAKWKLAWHSKAIGYVVSSRADQDIFVGPWHISTSRKARQRIASNPAAVLRLMEIANRYDRRIDHPTWEAIRSAMATRGDITIDDEAIRRFMALLSEPFQLGRYLRRLHELRVLEKLVPGFDHVRCLLQFNEYHKYTVDEHSLRTVEEATRFLSESDTLGRAYRKIKNKALFHLALLIHDIGKGYPEDHSEVGARIALQVAKHLKLDPVDTETLRFLVHRHLMLSHLAFRRDTGDEQLVLKHAVEVGSRETLRMLFVLTCADFAAVGPGVFNEWKKDVLCQLYRRMAKHLASSDDTLAESAERLDLLRNELVKKLPRGEKSEWIARHIKLLPAAYLEGSTAAFVLEDLKRLHALQANDAVAWGRYLEDRKVCEYSIGVQEDNVPGIFHRICGTLASFGLQILSAEIHTLADGLVLDRFYVIDDDFQGCPPEERFETISRSIEKALTDPAFTEPSFRRTWSSPDASPTGELSDLSTKVKVDNQTSDVATIIDVFTHDRPGLLYAISKAIFELGLSVNCAKIGTYLDQVVDVFYVTDQTGQKIESPDMIQKIENRLLQEIESHYHAV